MIGGCCFSDDENQGQAEVPDDTDLPVIKF